MGAYYTLRKESLKDAAQYSPGRGEEQVALYTVFYQTWYQWQLPIAV